MLLLLSHFSQVWLCDPRDSSPPGSPIPGILQARIQDCHFLLQCMKVKSESEVSQSCPTLSNPVDCSLPGSFVHGIFQARILEWGAISFSRGISQTQGFEPSSFASPALAMYINIPMIKICLWLNLFIERGALVTQHWSSESGVLDSKILSHVVSVRFKRENIY